MYKPYHDKILLDETCVGFPVFADYYRFGPDGKADVPMVVYVGGSVTAEEYYGRFEREPHIIVGEFEHAIGDSAGPIDLLVLSCPPFPDDMIDTVRRDLGQTGCQSGLLQKFFDRCVGREQGGQAVVLPQRRSRFARFPENRLFSMGIGLRVEHVHRKRPEFQQCLA